MRRTPTSSRARHLGSRLAVLLLLLPPAACDGDDAPTELEEGLRWLHLSGPYGAVAIDGEELPFRVHDLEGCEEAGAAHWLTRVELVLSSSTNPSTWTGADASVAFRDDVCNGDDFVGGDFLEGAYRAREDSLFLDFDGDDSLDLKTGHWKGGRVELPLLYRGRRYVATVAPG